MHDELGSRFLRSSDRTTIPSSPGRPVEEMLEMCGPLPGLRRLSPEDLAAVLPLMMLGRGFEPPVTAPVRAHRHLRAPFFKLGSQRAHSKWCLPPRALPQTSSVSCTALEELAQCAVQQQQLDVEKKPPRRASGAANDDDLLSSPPTEVNESAFKGIPLAYEERPDSSSSLPSPPPSPQVGSRARLCPLAHEHSSTRKHARACIACGSRQTPCWRPSWDPKQGKLCNSCGLRFRKSRARCVASGCSRIPARSELAEARMYAAGRPVRCRSCGGHLLFYSTAR